MKFSKQRLLILNAIKEDKSHPTADDVYSKLRPLNPSLSLGTVYRNLNNLAGSGELLKIHLPNGGDRYDADTSEHFHFVCDNCNEVFDLSLPQISESLSQVSSLQEFEVLGTSLIFNGRCKKCKTKFS